MRTSLPLRLRSSFTSRVAMNYKGPGSDSHPTSSKNAEKLIFAPAGDKTNAQADQYLQGSLSRSTLSPSPLTQFHAWFAHAQKPIATLANPNPPNPSKPDELPISDLSISTNTTTSAPAPIPVHQPETCCLSTASLPSGRVSARFVYLKELDPRGFVIYSNWETSRKAADVASNPFASLTFWWREQERQVRVEGKVERLSREESQVYYDTRARGSRIGAWASRQSSVLEGREELEERVRNVEKEWEGKEKIDVPEFWGGLRVVPERVEFWQGRESRLHDRFVYERVEGEGEEWTIKRLSP